MLGNGQDPALEAKWVVVDVCDRWRCKVKSIFTDFTVMLCDSFNVFKENAHCIFINNIPTDNQEASRNMYLHVEK